MSGNDLSPTMPKPPTLYIEGPAFWSPSLPGWDVARAAFRGEGTVTEPPAKRPAPMVLAPAERRRAPDTVALALEVAAASIAASGRNAPDVPCVFVSAHGDLAINDYMCTVLASDPSVLSPTKFHNSVHNAAVGYWTIGTGCMANQAINDRGCGAGSNLRNAGQCLGFGGSDAHFGIGNFHVHLRIDGGFLLVDVCG